MGLCLACAHDVLNWTARRREGIRDQRSMASPGYGLGAHNDRLFKPCRLNERFQAGCKFRCLHIVREAAERSVMPSGVG